MTEMQLKRAMEIKEELRRTQNVIKTLGHGHKRLEIELRCDHECAVVNMGSGSVSEWTLKQIRVLIMADARERKEELKREFEAL